MNYVLELRDFYIWLQENPLNATEQALWNRLMAYNNSFNWKKTFRIANSRLMLDLGISKATLVRSRKSLVDSGLIRYKNGAQNNCGTYEMMSINSEYEEESEPIIKTKQKKTKQDETKQEDLDCFSTVDNEELKNTLYDFAEMRRKMNKPLTPKAKETLLTQLSELSSAFNDQDGYKIRVLENSIMNSWQGVFPLKEFKDTSPYSEYEGLWMSDIIQ